jgi:hypothetical protein
MRSAPVSLAGSVNVRLSREWWYSVASGQPRCTLRSGQRRFVTRRHAWKHASISDKPIQRLAMWACQATGSPSIAMRKRSGDGEVGALSAKEGNTPAASLLIHTALEACTTSANRLRLADDLT